MKYPLSTDILPDGFKIIGKGKLFQTNNRKFAAYARDEKSIWEYRSYWRGMDSCLEYAVKESSFLWKLNPHLKNEAQEKDPNGICQHTPGAKMDAGKVKASLLLEFPRALIAIAEVASYGAEKYSRNGWEKVPNGVERYRDAEIRHLLKGKIERMDPESGLPHESHRVWNAIAALELELRENESK